MFENPEVDPASLPTADDVQWQALDPSYIRRLQVEAGITTLVVVGALLAIEILPFPLKDFMSTELAAAVVGLVLLRGLAWPAISVPRKGYAIRGRDILYRSGVLWRSVAAIPFNRVQHVETSHTPLDRQFGVASLKLFTAGSTGGDLKIHGLPAEVAESLRVFLLKQVSTRSLAAQASPDRGDDAGRA